MIGQGGSNNIAILVTRRASCNTFRFSLHVITKRGGICMTVVRLSRRTKLALYTLVGTSQYRRETLKLKCRGMPVSRPFHHVILGENYLKKR